MTARDRLDDLSQKITMFKMQNQGKLPEQAQSNVALVSSLQQNVATENEALSRATNEKMMQDSRLSELQNNFAFYSQRTEDTVMVGGGPGQMSAWSKTNASSNWSAACVRSAEQPLRSAQGIQGRLPARSRP